MQIAISIVASLIWAIGWGYLAWYLPACLALSGATLAGLLMNRQLFYNEADGKALERVNIVNALTLFRLSSLPTLLFLLDESRRHPVMPLLLAVASLAFLSDFLDGQLARKLKQVTRVGRILDSTSDYAVLIAVSIGFYLYGLAPAWFFILVMVRLIYHAAFMVILSKRVGQLQPETSILGKCAIAVTMGIYGTELLGFLVPAVPRLLIEILEYAAGVVIAASIVDKAFVHRKLIGALSSGSRTEALDSRSKLVGD
jgi:phosphatidylglycerophosphate synthase